jgi:uncharacterized protein YigA (DUF484 family)
VGNVTGMNKTEDIEHINTKIATSFDKIETGLSEAKNIAGLFEILFAGIEKEFEVPFVWLTLTDTVNNKPIIAAIKSSDVLQDRLKVITPELFCEILPAGLKPVLVNKDLQPYYKLLPSNRKYFVKSLALVPFKVNDEIAGSWNNGDAYHDRYTPEMETNLLQNLAQSVSAFLTEIVSAIK